VVASVKLAGFDWLYHNPLVLAGFLPIQDKAGQKHFE
jgi:hypothetical protein